jgi:hypothetical protein
VHWKDVAAKRSGGIPHVIPAQAGIHSFKLVGETWIPPFKGLTFFTATSGRTKSLWGHRSEVNVGFDKLASLSLWNKVRTQKRVAKRDADR